MTYREIILTKHLLTARITRVKQRYEELTTKKHAHTHHDFLEHLKNIIDNDTTYCSVCNGEIGINDIGKTIVTTRNKSYALKKWIHRDCAIDKNMI